jgi:hypothetical protein
MTIILDCDFLKKGEAANIPIGFLATCTVSDVVGDPVIFHPTVAGQVENISSNVYDGLVVGLISSKSSDTDCFVVTLGIPPEIILAGQDEGNPSWVSTTGGVTTTKPVTGHLQVIGNAVSPTSISINIEMRKTIQV